MLVELLQGHLQAPVLGCRELCPAQAHGAQPQGQWEQQLPHGFTSVSRTLQRTVRRSGGGATGSWAPCFGAASGGLWAEVGGRGLALQTPSPPHCVPLTHPSPPIRPHCSQGRPRLALSEANGPLELDPQQKHFVGTWPQGWRDDI
ncbi:hypothetical protein JEQ12_015875 [Ovis aries]|uniref:Uncharacterized protein n=1 Tax=Ovis aries TaxID=9940 RepID=A0A836D455_SHEEP|nr:hypothetical protein JEQ12_015875 [Ovis aries]